MPYTKPLMKNVSIDIEMEHVISPNIVRLAGGDESRGYRGPGWYHWDESGYRCYGPFETSLTAMLALIDYATYLDMENEDDPIDS